MYFYPHYFEITRKKQTYKTMIYELLKRLPTLYDTRIMPGSESLDSLGRDGQQYLAVTLDQFAINIIQVEMF